MAKAELDIIVKLRDEFSRGLSGITGSMSKLGGVVASGAAAGIAGVTAALGAATMAGLSYNNSVEQAGAKIQAFTKDHEETARILQMVQERASLTPFAYTEMANAASALMPTARAANAPLEDLLEISEILAASNPAQGLEGAAVALREAVSGDYVSLIERFNMPRSFINQLKEEGVPALEIVRQSLQSLGFDTSLVAGLANTAEGRWSTFQDTLQALAGQITQPIFNAFSGGLGQINDKLTELSPILDEIAGQIAYVIGGIIKGFSDAQGPINALAEYSGELPGVWQQVSEAATKLFFAIEAIKPVIAPLIPIIQDNLIPILISLAAIIGIALVAAFVTIVGPILLVAAKIALISAAIGGLVFAGVKLYQHVTTTYPQLSGQIVRAFETAKVFVMAAMQVIGRVVQTITAALVQFWQANGERIITQVQTTFNTAVAVVRSVMMQIQQTVATITAVIAAFWARYGNEIIATVSSLARQLGALWNDIYTLINAAMIGIGRVINTILREIQNYWRTNGQQIQNFAIGVFRYVSQQISAFMTVIRGVVQTITALIRGDWQGLANGLSTIVNGIYQNIVTTFSAIWSVIGPPLTTIKNGIISTITDAWNGITSNLANIKSRIISTITDAWNGITTTLTTIKNGIVNTISDAWNGITSNLANIKSRIISTITDAWNGITSNLANIKNRITSTITDAASAITTPLSDIKDDVIDAITDVKDWLSTFSLTTQATAIANSLINGIKDGISNGLESIKTAFKDVVRNALNSLPQPIRDALASLGFKVTRSAAATLPAPPPTTSRSASITAGSSPSIVINIGSVRDARDIDAIRRAVRDGMDEAARRGIVQSQLPRGI